MGDTTTGLVLPLPEDAPLVPAIDHPDERPGLAEVYARRYAPLVRLAYVLVDNTEQAEEIVQDAFARALARGDRVDDLGRYVQRSVVNGCHDVLRRRRIERRVIPRLRRVEPEPEPDYIADLLASLPPREAIALTLRYYGDLPVEEIARAMDVPLGTAKTLLRRGAARLKGEIER